VLFEGRAQNGTTNWTIPAELIRLATSGFGGQGAVVIVCFPMRDILRYLHQLLSRRVFFCALVHKLRVITLFLDTGTAHRRGRLACRLRLTIKPSYFPFKPHFFLPLSPYHLIDLIDDFPGFGRVVLVENSFHPNSLSTFISFRELSVEVFVFEHPRFLLTVTGI